MRLLILVLLLGTSTSFAAHEKFITRIHSIVYGELVGEEHILKFQNARTGFLKADQKVNAGKGELVQVELDEKSFIVKLDKLEEQDTVEYNTPFVTRMTYIPTELRDLNAANSVLSKFRGSSLKTSESFNRAHVWAYEAFKKYDLFSMKAFLFFSHKYIRKERLRIWFYVSPYVLHSEESGTREKILDKNLGNRPMDFQTWTNMFMKNRGQCQVIKNYSVYYKKDSGADCFLMKASMYFWHPTELETMEIEGVHKVNFFEWEVNEAYDSAFGISG